MSCDITSIVTTNTWVIGLTAAPIRNVYAAQVSLLSIAHYVCRLLLVVDYSSCNYCNGNYILNEDVVAN